MSVREAINKFDKIVRESCAKKILEEKELSNKIKKAVKELNDSQVKLKQVDELLVTTHQQLSQAKEDLQDIQLRKDIAIADINNIKQSITKEKQDLVSSKSKLLALDKDVKAQHNSERIRLESLKKELQNKLIAFGKIEKVLDKKSTDTNTKIRDLGNEKKYIDKCRQEFKKERDEYLNDKQEYTIKLNLLEGNLLKVSTLETKLNKQLDTYKVKEKELKKREEKAQDREIDLDVRETRISKDDSRLSKLREIIDGKTIKK